MEYWIVKVLLKYVHVLTKRVTGYLVLALCFLIGYFGYSYADKVQNTVHQATQQVEQTAETAKQTQQSISQYVKSWTDWFSNAESSEHHEESVSNWEALPSITEGSAAYGATIKLSELDSLSRPTGAYIKLTHRQEPGVNGEKRPKKINVDPTAWKNTLIDGNWTNDRSHLIGYQFSGLMDEPRNLFTGFAYVNRGIEGKGSDESNTESMLYYEQQLDRWMQDHPDEEIEYVVIPLYQGEELIPRKIQMEWRSVNGFSMHFGGKTEKRDGWYTVLLDNTSPSYEMDYTTGYVSKK